MKHPRAGAFRAALAPSTNIGDGILRIIGIHASTAIIQTLFDED